MQMFLVRTDQQNWGKGLTLEEALKNASLSLDSAFTVTIFERDAVLTMEDIRVSDVDGSAEYPRDTACTTIRCKGIMKALEVSAEDLLAHLDDWVDSMPDSDRAVTTARCLGRLRLHIESQFDEEDICKPIKV